MKWIVNFTICMLSLWTLHAHAQTLEGVWTLEQCIITQDSAGVVSSIDYRISDGNIPKWYIFTELTFGDENSCSIMLNNSIIEGEYSLTDEGMLKLDFIILLAEYHCILASDTMLVLRRRHYFYNESNPESDFIDIELYYYKNR